MIKLYGLEALEASVARVDPKTGEKINKLRKSYEGQIKSFGLAGKNKAWGHDPEKDGMTLQDLGRFPAEEFHNQKVMGKPRVGQLSNGALEKLTKAMEFQKGKTRNNAEWETALGLDRKSNIEDVKGKKQEVPKKIIQPTTVQVKVNGHTNGVTSVPETNRPSRVGKRRRYDEESYVGYGEGFEDDQFDDDSSNEGSRRSGESRKKHRKVTIFPNFFLPKEYTDIHAVIVE